jgi:hypothetical protein
MSVDAEQRQRSGVIHAVRPSRWWRLTEIKVRQAENEPPTSARPRFAWNMGEVSGSLGDLGTFLPHIVGAITVVKMDPTGILTTFGLFYAFAGAFYGVPMAVQPMKAASAAVLIEPMEPAAIAGAGLVIGAFFLILGLTGVVSRFARALPGSIAAGLQLGLGLSLAALGIRPRSAATGTPGADGVAQHPVGARSRPAISATACAGGILFAVLRVWIISIPALIFVALVIWQFFKAGNQYG